MKKTISGSVLNIASVASVIQESFMPCKTCGNDMSLMALLYVSYNVILVI